jgi:hypothetical protein
MDRIAEGILQHSQIVETADMCCIRYLQSQIVALNRFDSYAGVTSIRQRMPNSAAYATSQYLPQAGTPISDFKSKQ